MRCNNCGYEFGVGLTCQHCGIDRVKGLAEYPNGEFPSGSGSTIRSSMPNPSSSTPSHTPSPTGSSQTQILCWGCGEIIPGDSEYCPVCGKQLWHKCPKCGHKFSTQYLICNKCGANREQALKEQEIAKSLAAIRAKKEEEEKRQAEAEKARKEENERLEREKNSVKLLKFEITDWENKYDKGIYVKLRFENASSFRLLCLGERRKGGMVGIGQRDSGRQRVCL